jgi:hypothetical protein
MAKSLLIIITLIFCFSCVANAQSDTSNYDLGRILVKKQFTQGITVKGHDLEQYQFSDLADAINVWFYGTYSNASTLVYVIDGNIINDVNAYSIYDIDEITLVQNALGQVSGASPGQQLVLIKLKTDRPGKQGITAAEQTSLVGISNTNNTQGERSSSRLYNQYYLSGYKNFDDFSLGLSADYQRDVFPQVTDSYSSSSPPFNFNRVKLHLWGETKLMPGSIITIGVNYAPQTSVISDSYTLYNANNASYATNYQNSGHISQHLFNATIGIKTNIIEGLNNNLSVAYNLYNYFEKNNLNYSIPNYYVLPSGAFGALNGNTNIYAANNTSNLLIRDNITYHKKLGNFELEPSLNFSYRKVHYATNYSTLAESGYENDPNFLTGVSTSSSNNAFSGEYETYLLTPSVSVIYSKFLNLQAGFVDILNPNKDFIAGYSRPGISPFLSLSAEVAKIPRTGFDLKIFGSFSRQNQILNDEYSSLVGFATAANPITSSPAYFFSGSTGSTILTTSTGSPYQSYNNYQAGLVLKIPRNFVISYNFENRFYQTPEEIGVFTYPYTGQTTLTYVNDETITNRLAVNYYLGFDDFSWSTGINMTESKLQVTNQGSLPDYNSSYLNTGHRWSGGFTNRFQYDTFFAGLDILYQIGERPYSLIYADPQAADYVAPSGSNSFSLQSLYIGTEIEIPGLKHANVYLNGRNILQNKASDITDNRRYLGFGFRAGL